MRETIKNIWSSMNLQDQLLPSAVMRPPNSINEKLCPLSTNLAKKSSANK